MSAARFSGPTNVAIVTSFVSLIFGAVALRGARFFTVVLGFFSADIEIPSSGFVRTNVRHASFLSRAGTGTCALSLLKMSNRRRDMGSSEKKSLLRRRDDRNECL